MNVRHSDCKGMNRGATHRMLALFSVVSAKRKTSFQQ